MKALHRLTHKYHNLDCGILLVRLALSAAFIHAGWLKVTNMEIVIGGFAQAGLPMAVAYLVAYVELLGGLAVLIGIFARYAGLLLGIIMIVAIGLVHFPHGFGAQNGGFEYPLVLLCLAISLFFTGSGKYSLAGWLKNR